MSIQHLQTLGITKYKDRDHSNDSVTLRLMTEHDLAMLYEWLNRSHIVEWWGGEEARPTLADVQEQYLPSVLAQESVTPYIAMLNGEPIGYAQSYVALGSGDGWWKKKTDPGVRGIDQSLANASQLGKGLGTKLVRALVELLHSNDPDGHQDPNGPVAEQLERSDATEKAGFERQGTVPPQMVQPCTWFKHAVHSSEHAVLPNLFPSRGDVQGLAPLAAPHVKR